MKKLIKLSLIALIIMCFMGNVYAVLSCDVDIKTSKTEYNENEEFTVDIDLVNVQADKGIIAFGGTLEYDKDSLELLKIEGKNEWTKPSYNEQNGKFVVDRGSVTTSNETVLQITFRVKNANKPNSIILLKNVSISDGSETKKIDLKQKSITIKSTINPDLTPGTDNGENPSEDKNQNGNTGTNGNTTYNKGKLPQTGQNNITLIMVVSIVIFAIIIGASIIKIRVINKKEIEK